MRSLLMNTLRDHIVTLAPQLELEDLLSESPAGAACRAAARFSIGERESLALYGAGNLGRDILSRLRSLGVEPAAFVDDTPAKQDTAIDGLMVLSVRDFAERFGHRAVLVVTVFNPGASFRRIKHALASQTDARIVSFLEVAWKYPAALLPHYQFELPQNLLEKGEAIRRGLRLFSDEESRRQYVAHVRFRLHLDFETLPASNLGDYFPADVVPDLPPDTTFVDCGAFDGDTIRRFISRQHGGFREIFAVEPDRENFRKLTAYVSTLGKEDAARIHLIRAAVGARRARLRFESHGGMASALSHNGTEEVEVLPAQEIVSAQDGGALFLKFDVEGAESEALAGAAELTKQLRTITAVCVYHKPDDLWALPTQLQTLAPEHLLHLRTQGEDGMDVVCYAVPKAH